MQKAADALTAGQTVYVKKGEYAERVRPQNSGSQDNLVSYIAYPDEQVVTSIPHSLSVKGYYVIHCILFWFIYCCILSSYSYREPKTAEEPCTTKEITKSYSYSACL